MTYNVSKLNDKLIAYALAKKVFQAFTNNDGTEFYTYTDVADIGLLSSEYMNVNITEAKGTNLFLITYNAADGTYPIDRTKPMLPRKK